MNKFIRNLNEIENLHVEGKANILFIEGYDKVGKSSIINNILANYKNVEAYQPSWSKFESPLRFLDKARDGYHIGISIVDFLSQLTHFPKNLIVIDRSIFSSVVYNDMYGSSNDVQHDVLKLFLKQVNAMKSKLNITYLIVEHKSRETARVFYNNTLGRMELVNYDEFFDYYDLHYTRFKELLEKEFESNITDYYKTNSIDFR